MPETQELDVYRSDDLEEDVEKAGFHLSPIGSLIVSLCFLALIPIILHPDKSPTMEIMWILFIIGFAMKMSSHVSSVMEFETMFDAISWGIGIGAIIAVVEVAVAGAMIDYRAAIPIEDSIFLMIVVCVGAVGEEMLYRGGIQTYFRQYFITAGLPNFLAATIAVTIGAITFSLGHMFVFNTWNLFAALFAGGILFGAAYEWKKDLTVPIIAHLVLNLSSLKEEVFDLAMANLLLVIIAILITVTFIYVRRVS